MNLPPSDFSYLASDNSVETSISLEMTHKFVFTDGKNEVVITIDLDKKTVVINPKLASDDAAKKFWNSVQTVVGNPKLFPEVE